MSRPKPGAVGRHEVGRIECRDRFYSWSDAVLHFSASEVETADEGMNLVHAGEASHVSEDVDDS